jgi:branched-subunit amino acid aminotransferase/4-amino-4-deoxychorismate lyase
LDAKEHLKRLRKSSEINMIDVPWKDEELIFEIEHLLSQVPDKKKYIRLLITSGDGLGLVGPVDAKPNKIIYCMPAKIEKQDVYSNGLKLDVKKLPFTERGRHAKSGNYLRSINALKDAQSQGWDDILWLNSEDEFTEASTANIFLIGREGDLVEIATPPSHSGLLLGITRQSIIKLLTMSQIKVTERIIHKEELARFDEAFICSTVRGLVPIRQIGKHKMFTCRSNATFHHINRLYMAWVQQQVGYALDWRTGIKI